jgi:putative transposase
LRQWVQLEFAEVNNSRGRTQAAMAKKKKHSRAEIAAKLAQANELAAQGKLQIEIARTLGVSVMTLHRWRKAPRGIQPPLVATQEAARVDWTPGSGDRIAELQLQNLRLRRLVTDLLLEKIRLEEAIQNQKSRRDGTRRASR